MSNGTYHGDDTITVTNRTQLGESELLRVIAHVRDCLDGHEISDAAALTIAAYWQSPGRDGIAFAQLASTGHVRLEDLADNISAAFDEASAAKDIDGYNELGCLATWALN